MKIKFAIFGLFIVSLVASAGQKTKIPKGVDWPIQITCKSSGKRIGTRKFYESLCANHKKVCGMKNGKFICCDQTEDEDCSYEKKAS